MSPHPRAHTAHFLVSKFLNSKESLKFNLSSTDRHVLRYVADFIDMANSSSGQRQSKILLGQAALFTGYSITTVKRSLRKLIKTNLLNAICRASGVPGIYTLGNVFETEVTQTQVSVDNSKTWVTQTQVPPVDKADLGHTDPGPGSHRPGPGSHRPISNKISNNSYKKEQSARPSVAPAAIFQPNEENIRLAKELNLDLARELSTFLVKSKGPQTQKAFEGWLYKGHEYALCQTAQGRRPILNYEIRSTVPEWGPGHDTYDRLYGPKAASG